MIEFVINLLLHAFLNLNFKGTAPFFNKFYHNYHFFFWVKKYPQVSGKRVPKY